MGDLGAGRGEKEGVGGEEEIGGKSQELEVGGVLGERIRTEISGE